VQILSYRARARRTEGFAGFGEMTSVRPGIQTSKKTSERVTPVKITRLNKSPAVTKRRSKILEMIRPSRTDAVLQSHPNLFLPFGSTLVNGNERKLKRFDGSRHPPPPPVVSRIFLFHYLCFPMRHDESKLNSQRKTNSKSGDDTKKRHQERHPFIATWAMKFRCSCNRGFLSEDKNFDPIAEFRRKRPSGGLHELNGEMLLAILSVHRL
jgi:hypothetical protein